MPMITFITVLNNNRSMNQTPHSLKIFGVAVAATITIFIPETHHHQAVANSFQPSNEINLIQPVIPVVKVGERCPTAFLPSQGYCLPTSKNSRAVIPTQGQVAASACPLGFRNVNGYCQMLPTVMYFAIPMITDSCPRGYYKSNQFCIKAN